MGAIAPSSQMLAKFMCKHVQINDGYVVEIGAGTGRLTQSLLQSGIPEGKLIIVELDLVLYQFLKRRFPNLNVIHGDATQLAHLLPPDVVKNISTIISGIPLINLPSQIVKQLCLSCFEVLKDDGILLQFTYRPTSPIPAKELGLHKKRLGHVFFNIPPATVWRYQKHENPYVHEGATIKRLRKFRKKILDKL